MKEKLKGLDAVRAFACVGIFTFHCWLNELGTFAVAVFFMLSGFLLVYNYIDRESFQYRGIKECLGFSVKRIAKFYPLYFLMLCVVMAYLFVFGWDNMSTAERRGNLAAFAVSLPLLQSWFPNKAMSLNGAVWFLSDMLFLYMLFPPILRLIKSYKSRKTAFIAIAAAALLMMAAILSIVAVYDAIYGPGMAEQKQMDQYFSYIFPLYRLGDFFIGCNLAYIFLTREKKQLSPKSATALEALAVLACVLAYWVFCGMYLPLVFNSSHLFMLPSMLLIYSFALGQGYISRLLDCRAVSFIAELSTEIFLTHMVAIKFGTVIVNMLPLPEWLMKWGGFAGITAVTLLVSWLWHRYVNPSLRHAVKI